MYSSGSINLYRLALSCLLLLSISVVNARFQMNGPVLTLTLRDALEETIVVQQDSGEPVAGPRAKWFPMTNLKPNLSWTLGSKGKPLPNWVPAWDSWSLTALWDHAAPKKGPLPISQLEGMASIHVPNVPDATVQIQPIWNLSHGMRTYLVQFQKGPFQVLARIANRGLASLKGCWSGQVPMVDAIGGVRITPQWDLVRQQPSCLIEATTQSQRTKTCLYLENQNPTLKIVHALDERHVIAPEISLYNAKITYQWDITLKSGSIRTLVDPTRAIQMTWTDLTPTGRWVTDVRVPLVGTTWKQLAGDVRVRRQFKF